MTNENLQSKPWVGLTLFTILYLQNAWIPGFFADGYLYAAFGKNAAELGYWLIPHLTESINNEFFHHTPFIFILEGLFFKSFGSGYLQARIFGASFALFVFLSMWRFLKRINFKPDQIQLVLFLFISIPPLIKKSRFPNLDTPLMLFVFLSLLFQYLALEETNQKGRRRYWFFSGALFGLALLTKGPAAILVLIASFFYLLVSKKLKVLLGPAPWLGMCLGFLIFSIWPTTLYFSDKTYIFKDWLHFTFVETILEARGEPSPFYTYFLFLIKNASIWFILSLLAFHPRVLKNNLAKFSLIMMWSMLLFLSMARFKYSNYLMPIYPFMALCSGLSILEFKKSAASYFSRAYLTLTTIVGLALLSLPLTNGVHRDKPIFETRRILGDLKVSAKRWVIFGDSYPFWNLASLNAYEDRSHTVRLNDLNGALEGDLLIVKGSDASLFNVKEFQRLAYFEGVDIWAIYYSGQQKISLPLSVKFP